MRAYLKTCPSYEGHVKPDRSGPELLVNPCTGLLLGGYYVLDYRRRARLRSCAGPIDRGHHRSVANS
jgi:hypothetical protein